MKAAEIWAFLRGEVFPQGGLPLQIKTDNGLPFGYPMSDLPSELALILAGYGVELRCNTPRSPWENGAVEKNQDTTGRWVDPAKCFSVEQVQQRLDHAAQVHLYQLPARKFSNKTRVEACPELLTPKRPWKNARFSLKRVYRFLAQGAWIRRIAPSGQINLYGHLYYISSKLKGEQLEVRFDPKNVEWQAFNLKGELIKALPAKSLSRQDILNLSVCQRTKGA